MIGERRFSDGLGHNLGHPAHYMGLFSNENLGVQVSPGQPVEADPFIKCMQKNGSADLKKKDKCPLKKTWADHSRRAHDIKKKHAGFLKKTVKVSILYVNFGRPCLGFPL